MACGFMFGTGQFAVGVSWVYVSLSTFGGMPMALAVVFGLLSSTLLTLIVVPSVYHLLEQWLGGRVPSRPS